MTARLVTPETLAAALAHPDMVPLGYDLGLSDSVDPERAMALAILAALPPDPRLDALLAAARGAGHDDCSCSDALRDALAAFEEAGP